MILPGRRRFARTAAGRVVASASAHRLPALAAESAFFAALSVFPALLTVVAILRTAAPALPGAADTAAVEGMTRLLRLVLTTRGSAAADAATALLATSTPGLLTVGTAAAVVLVVRTLRSVLHGLATISGTAPRSWRVATVLGVLLLVGAATVTAAAVQDPIAWLGVPGGHLLWRVLRWPLMLLALFGWAVLVLRSGVRRRNRRALVAAGALSVGGWVLASALYPVYVSVAASVAQGLGALGGGLILLVWLYLLMASLYLAAETLVVRSSPPRTPTTRGDEDRG
ncbi:YhjD/YihY/BrkB family envelope integrity protein [Actinomycetospora sp. CA-084318]|uniref:YhjD/YihY/BrkB family envelope integrity protein n=1 Tax=Actinomycetospora sp. CA-084318 TaxID=3239892 RepID=UPI003D971E98